MTIRNNDLKVIDEVLEYLGYLQGEKAKQLYNKLNRVYVRLADSKKVNSKQVIASREKKKKYYQLINNYYYNLKAGNTTKAKEYREKAMKFANLIEKK